MINILAIAAGGASGAVLRHFLNGLVVAMIPGGFPAGIMAINILGSFLMGALTGIFAFVYDPSQTIKLFVMVGLLGGFTTFSAFSLDAVLLWERGQIMQAMVYITASVVFSIFALMAGLWVVRMLNT